MFLDGRRLHLWYRSPRPLWARAARLWNSEAGGNRIVEMTHLLRRGPQDRSSICVIRVLEREEKAGRAEKKEIMAENSKFA